MTVVYYRGPFVHITDELVQVWNHRDPHHGGSRPGSEDRLSAPGEGPEHYAFRIEDLDSVYVVSDSRPDLPLCLLPVAAVAVAVALPMVAAPRGLWVVAALVVLASIVLAARLRSAKPPYELYASHHGVPVRLFRCCDARVFGQVRRALMRAIQDKSRW